MQTRLSALVPKRFGGVSDRNNEVVRVVGLLVTLSCCADSAPSNLT